MRTIKAQPLTHEEFAPFGTFYKMDEPDGYACVGDIHKFYPDRVTVNPGTQTLAFSPLVVEKQDKMVITMAEYHTTTCEILMPIEDDIVIHVAPASGDGYPADFTKAFIVKKNTVVKLNTAVWHLAPLPLNKEKATTLIVLPERTYANDCTVVDLTPEQQFIIEA